MSLLTGGISLKLRNKSKNIIRIKIPAAPE
jgi:hypothetical protein